jgi:hypothetical protein
MERNQNSPDLQHEATAEDNTTMSHEALHALEWLLILTNASK